MRVTCPKCSTEYEIDISVLPETGRVVKCWKCAHDWLQTRPPSNFEARSEPDSAPLQEPVETDNATPRGLDPKFARVLQEEAERERLAREEKSKAKADDTKADYKIAANDFASDDTPADETASKTMSELVWPFPKNKKAAEDKPEPGSSANDNASDAKVKQTTTEKKQDTSTPGLEVPPNLEGTDTKDVQEKQSNARADTSPKSKPPATPKFTVSRRSKQNAVDMDLEASLEKAMALDLEDDFLMDWDEDEKVTPTQDSHKNQTTQPPTSTGNASKIHKVPVRIEADTPEEEPKNSDKKRKTGGAFRRGFISAVFLFVLATLAYIFAPQISEKFPQAEPQINQYVTKIDAMRKRINAIIIPSEDAGASGQ